MVRRGVTTDGGSHGAIVALRALGGGVLVGATVVSALMAVELDFGVPRAFVALLMGFLGFAFVSAGEGIVVGVWRVLRVLFGRRGRPRGLKALHAVQPVPVGRILGAFVYVAGDVLWPQSFLKQVTLPVVGEIAIGLTGVFAMAVALARVEGRTRARRVAWLAPPTVLFLAFVLWVAQPGFDGYVVAAPVVATPSTPALDDPGTRGPFAVRTLTYGSGTSTRRPEYGPAADLLTTPVDGSEIFRGYGGLAGSFFRWYWGFDVRELPVNGLVWSPQGAGPFPLVLIVHGNHAMSTPSEPGYAYLGEHLASQGYLVAAIDQNFLNGLFFFDGEFAEMPLRAWSILQHLRQWRRWNETPGNPFEGRVDLDRVALVGHSRGGEAVAWAAHLNGHAMEPVSRVSGPGDFGFGIRGVVAIAPSDAYEGPGGLKPTSLGASYLLLAGGHDADGFVLFGQAQYSRAGFDDDPGRFKALAYVHQANHGQFNSVWGARDRGLYNSLLLNRAPLLAEEAQQRVAKALVTSFLHAALREDATYRAPFANPPTRGDGPSAGLVVTQLNEAAAVVVEDFDGADDRHPTEAGSDGVQVGVEALLQRDGERAQGNRALRLTWQAGTQPSYEIRLPPDDVGRWAPTPAHALSFTLASVPGATPPAGVVVELDAEGGASARLALGAGAPLVHALPAHLVKARWLYGLNGFPGQIRPEEVVLQTYTLPFAAFAPADPEFDPAGLTAIRFTFSGDEAGAIYLDDIALSRPLALPVVAAPGERQPRAPAVDRDGIGAFVESEMARAGIPGLSLAVVGDDVVHLQGYGTADVAGRAVTPQTPFVIGSVGKTFTALAIQQLAQDGLLDLQAPVQRYVPAFSLADPQAAERITLQQLLDHTSGLPKAAGEQAHQLDPRYTTAVGGGVAPAASPLAPPGPAGRHHHRGPPLAQLYAAPSRSAYARTSITSA